MVGASYDAIRTHFAIGRYLRNAKSEARAGLPLSAKLILAESVRGIAALRMLHAPSSGKPPLGRAYFGFAGRYSRSVAAFLEGCARSDGTSRSCNSPSVPRYTIAATSLGLPIFTPVFPVPFFRSR